MADITVTEIKPSRAAYWRVTFSEPVRLWYLPHMREHTSWYVTNEGDAPYRTDELGAYLWALKVIEKHKEMEQLS